MPTTCYDVYVDGKSKKKPDVDIDIDGKTPKTG